MKLIQAKFLTSSTTVEGCPKSNKPEFAFIGRSNVGKSTLINMITNQKGLAKTSGKPGKTQTINHFLVNDDWYLVDLPGYGYASVSKSIKKSWGKMIEDYLLQRENLVALFVLVDARHDPQPIDLDFINWAGGAGLPLCIVVTKADKVTRNILHRNLTLLKNTLLKSWESLPPFITTSSTEKRGREEVIDFIESSMTSQN